MDISRVGNVTSSEIVSLMADGKAAGSIGAPFYTYVEECNMERRLGMALEKEVSTFDMTWGKLCERFAFDLLGTTYEDCSTKTIVHPINLFWVGTPDGIKHDEGKTVVDTKCPGTRKSFCQLVDAMLLANGEMNPDSNEVWDRIMKKHKDGKKFFWQLVSNAILTDSKYAELVVVMPYQSQLPIIREMAAEWDGADQWQFKKIYEAFDETLPYLKDGGYYKNMYVFRFEVEQASKDALTARVLKASESLITV